MMVSNRAKMSSVFWSGSSVAYPCVADVYTVGNKRRFDTNKRLLKWHELKILAPENQFGFSPDNVTFAEAVKAAVEAFTGLGTFEVQQRADSIEVTIRDPDPLSVERYNRKP